MTTTRTPAVAGVFYSGDPIALERDVAQFLERAAAADECPKALIVPHAGYRYSGAVAAAAYARLAPLADRIRRVVLLGPSHRVPLRGMALPTVDRFQTPLGAIGLDRELIERLSDEPGVVLDDAAHAEEHSLEVQLPFLQLQLEAFWLVPIAVGQCAPDTVANVLDRAWDGDETLIVVSTDLSHFHDYDAASMLDRATCDAILRRDASLGGQQACGCHALNGLLCLARRRDLTVRLLERCNSGDVTGDRARVVGYASFAVHENGR